MTSATFFVISQCVTDQPANRPLNPSIKLGGAAFLGRADVPLKPLFDKEPVRLLLELKNDEGLREGRPFGFLDVAVRWRFNPSLRLNLEAAGGGGGGGKGGAGYGGGDDGGGDDDDDDFDDEEDGATTEAGKAKAAADLAAALDEQEAGATKVVSGDYMVYVHVIECRDLKAKDLAGSSDPVVYVDCLGQAPVNTAIAPQTLNPVFDDSFAISVRNLDVRLSGKC